MAIYKRGRGLELGTTENKSSKWPEWDLNKEQPECESDALTTQPRCSGSIYFTLCLLGMSITAYLYFKGDFAWCTIILPLKQYDHSIKTTTKQQSTVVSVCWAFALKLFGSFLRFEDGH